MIKKYTAILFALLFAISTSVWAQYIPQSVQYTQIYDFLDELAGEGIIHLNSAIKPYNRNLIA